jgi:curli production assembly/transport component CsgG/holdfast attachment protein HfaB
MRRLTLALLATAALSACAATPPTEQPIATVRGPVPVTSTTPMDDALRCLARWQPRDLDLRLAVQSIPDRTGVADYDGPGAYATQGAELMMVTALGKAQARQVNRLATAVAEWELTQALEQRLGEGKKVQVGKQAYPYRPVQMGAFLGSTHTIFGGITELDFDIASGGAEIEIAGIGARSRGYYVSVGLDIMVADTRSTEIVLSRSYRKQIWGQEVEGSVFRFWDIGSGGDDIGDLGLELFDLRIGEQKNEPLQAGIRWAIELAAYELVRDLAGLGDRCEQFVPQHSRSTPSTLALAAPDRPQQLAALAPPAAAAKPQAAKQPAKTATLQPDNAASPAPERAPLASSEPPAARPARLSDGTVLPKQKRAP